MTGYKMFEMTLENALAVENRRLGQSDQSAEDVYVVEMHWNFMAMNIQLEKNCSWMFNKSLYA